MISGWAKVRVGEMVTVRTRVGVAEGERVWKWPQRTVCRPLLNKMQRCVPNKSTLLSALAQQKQEFLTDPLFPLPLTYSSTRGAPHNELPILRSQDDESLIQ